jgi:hypothetical protein
MSTFIAEHESLFSWYAFESLAAKAPGQVTTFRNSFSAELL